MTAPKFKVYDEVWVMRGSRPTKLLVFAVVESMAYWKTGTEFHYQLVDHRVGAGWGNNEGERYALDKVFATKEELVASL